ncbi:uncharacterized protein LOC119726911 [Patiria miniata]|uniref:Reverse transcriptase domain-containing protein n=1 Tax=Patiria miniata TaxID=46514 RepID=A0A913ZSU4_PATMI|nr:uncharacterized protein LOC119726911 [Patiria miniata]
MDRLPTSTRPSRTVRPPKRFKDFALGSPTGSHRTSSTTSHHSSRSSCSHISQLSDSQAAKLTAMRKQSQLQELQRQIAEDELYDTQLKEQDDRARAARMQLEEVERQGLRERETITMRLSRRRRLRQAELELRDAEAVKSFLQEDADPAIHDISEIPCSQPTADPTLSLSNTSLNTPDVAETDQTVLTTSQVPVNGSPPSAPTCSITGQQPVTPVRTLQETGCDSLKPVFPTSNTLQQSNHTPVCNPGAPPSSVITPTSPPTLGTVPEIASVNTNLMDLLMASSLGVPKPTLPKFSSGREKDFALLKIALQNLVNVHPHLSEQYKYQVLIGSLDGKALKLAKSYLHSSQPYTKALAALSDKYGQPRQLVQTEIAAIMMTPPIKHNDTESFEDFCLDVSSLVGMLESLDGQAEVELRCGSHVDKLLSKLSPSLRTSFIEHCIKKGILKPNSGETYTLPQFAAWLKLKSQSQMLAKQAVTSHIQDQSSSRVNRDHRPVKQKPTPTSAFLTGGKQEKSVSPKYTKPKPKPFCPFCDGKDHFLNGCQTFKALSTEEIVKWIQENKCCWKCCRKHEPDACTLKKPCHQCKEVHLTVLHEAAQKATSVFMVKPTSQSVYVDKPSRPCNTMLKVVRVTLHGPDSNIDSYAVLDDGSERTMLLQDAAQQLKLSGTPETMHLQTVREDLVICQGKSVSLSVSPHDKPDVKFSLDGVFAAGNLCLSEYTYPVKILQECYPHLRDLPLPLVDRARQVILIGSDHVDLIAPRRPIRFGPSGTPVAALTRLGWTLHGPASILKQKAGEQWCFKLSAQSETAELMRHVEKLWQVDVVPYVNEQHVVRSKQDQRAVQLLEDKTARVVEGGIQRYVTPLLRTDNAKFHAPKEAVLPTLRRTERRLATRPSLAEKHNELIQKLVDAGYVRILAVEDAAKSEESWYIPHHTVENNGKFRLVFNCSFQYQNQILNEHLLPGPSLGASLLGVLLRFRQHAVAVSGDIKAMFHQVRLQPTERCLFRFLWRNMKTDTEPKIYEWQVLPFGATCSPCCATCALRKHAFDHREKSAEVADAVDRSFYVDNCLVSVPQEDEAKALVHNMRDLLAKGGFEIRQWASNVPNVVADLPPEARSDGCDLWLTFGETDLAEPMLGLQWDCSTDDLQYRHRVVNYDCLNMRNMYKTLASQYDPNGYLTPFTARARVIVQDLWKTKRDWDDALEPGEIMDRWRAWENELPNLSVINLTRCYTPPDVSPETASRQLHIICDASERIYGAVAYLRTEDEKHTIHTSFL